MAKTTTNNIDKLLQEIEKINTPSKSFKQDDESYWKPELDKAGNGYAVIRFLPAPEVDGEDALPWVRYFDHGFQGPAGKWYIENSLTTLNQKDPVSEYNSVLWNQGKAGQELARKQKRRLHYVSLIEVVEDAKNPQNIGKRFKFKYGKKIFDKITEAMNPQLPGEMPVNPFDLEAGAHFKLSVRKVEGYPNYDLSKFANSSSFTPKSKDDPALSLKALLDPKNFKSYTELKSRLDSVLDGGFAGAPTQLTGTTQSTTAKTKTLESLPTTEDDDEDISRFAKLVND